jgi:beta-galactosidase
MFQNTSLTMLPSREADRAAAVSPPTVLVSRINRVIGRLPGLITLLVVVGIAASCVAQDSPAAGNARAVFNFNPEWKLFVGDPTNAAQPEFDDASWEPVTLPHAWNEDAAFRVSIDKHPTGIAWYRKRFTLPADAIGKKVFLEFEGVRQAGEFYVNGKWIGRHENGITAVGFDVTELVQPAPAENIVAVRTDNDWNYREKATNQRYQWSDRNFNANYGGIPKNVKLHVTGKLYQTLPLYAHLKTTGVYIYARDFDVPGKAATITAESEVRNEHGEPRTFSYEVVIYDRDSKVIKAFSGESVTLAAGQTTTVKAAARVDGLNFWSWGYGYLYDVRTTLKVDGMPVDTVVTRTGFRKTEFGNGMVKLNGRVIQMKGYAQRTSNEWPALGNAVPPWLSDFSNGLMVESGGNLVRWMHIAPAKQDVESCDRVGLLQAMPAGDAEADVTGRRWEQRVEVMREAIIYNRNNPSIIFYEAGNKGVREAHMAEMKALRDQYDPHGGRAAGSREMLDSRLAEWGGEMLYINKSARIPFWQTEYSRDEGLRKYWDEFSPPFHKDGDGPLYREAPAREYNRNQDSHAIENVVRWYDYWRERPGTGTRVNSGGVNIIFSDSNTHYRGAENYRRSGEVDALRIPKDAFFTHQVMWDGWVDVERPRAHIIGHWNYASGTKKDVYVVSSADKVELLLNGKSLGFGAQTNRFLFMFRQVDWQPGELRAVGMDLSGKKLCEAVYKTAGEAVTIKLTAMTAPGGLKADGADVALIEVEVVDAQGRRCPTNLNLIEFELTGPAEWRGGIAQGPGNYILSKQLPVECGVNRVLVRSLPQAGQITLAARATGLKPASVTLESQPVIVANGLAKSFPSDRLPSRLNRGPTPLSPSFQVTRVAVPIANVTAGANADQVVASYDDNERTSWANDNRLATAWISYELARPAALIEVTLKLSRFRDRSYPLRITMDGAEVFRGRTPRSLGYVTLPVRAAKGRTVRVELIGATTSQDAFNITELENRDEVANPEARPNSGVLSIVEIEFYESATARETRTAFAR